MCVCVCACVRVRACKGRFVDIWGGLGTREGGLEQGGFINLEFSDRIWAFLGVAHVDKKNNF